MPKPTSSPQKPEAEAQAPQPEEKKELTAEEKKAKEIAEKREKLKKLREELKGEEDKLREKKKAEKEAVQKERAEKEAKLKAADEKIAKCKEALEKTKEWKALDAATKEREAIGPLPKIRKTGARAGGGGNRKKYGDFSGNEFAAAEAIDNSGHAMSRKELSEATGISKGWSKMFKEGNGGLCDRGICSLVQHEGDPMRYELTTSGKEALAKARAERDSSE